MPYAPKAVPTIQLTLTLPNCVMYEILPLFDSILQAMIEHQAFMQQISNLMTHRITLKQVKNNVIFNMHIF